MTQLLTNQATEAKGFALYVGISESEAQAAGLSLAEIAGKLRETIAELLPEKASETYATLAIAPANAAGRNLDITRIALKEPKATAIKTGKQEEVKAAKGLVVDLKELIYVSSAGIRDMIMMAKDCKALGVALSLHSVDPNIAGMINFGELAPFLPVYDDESDARAAVAPGTENPQ